MFIDTHCHLDFDIFDKIRQKLVDDCSTLGINNFINPATQTLSWDKLLEINKQFSNMNICFVYNTP